MSRTAGGLGELREEPDNAPRGWDASHVFPDVMDVPASKSKSIRVGDMVSYFSARMTAQTASS